MTGIIYKHGGSNLILPPIKMHIQDFHIAGINYKKSDANVRGQFAVTDDAYSAVLAQSAQAGISEVFVLSTCNRTEIYGVCSTQDELIDLLCNHTAGSKEEFLENCYIKSGWQAVEHLFNVGAGLDSQILGDYEIVGQLKQAARFSKENNCVGPFIERLVNTVLQASKEVKNQTKLSAGTVSVAYAAVQYIKETIGSADDTNILLVGTGKIGRNTCRNLVDYLGTKNITLANRTEETAMQLANELGIQHASINNLDALAKEAGVIIVATNASRPVILKEHIEGAGKKILIDLSIPNNIDTSVSELAGVDLINVDGLSKINDRTLRKRMAEVPKAKSIIVKHIHEFVDWCMMRRNAPALKAIRQKMLDMQTCPMFSPHLKNKNASAAVNEQAIQQHINNMAAKMRSHHQPGCFYIQAINDFIAAHAD